MQPLHTRFLAVFSLAALSACAAGPDYRRPPVAAPATFSRQSDVQARDAPLVPVSGTTWWASFGDPALDRFVGVALAQNLDLAQAIARVQQARASLRTADAALFPTGTVGGSALRQKISVDTPVGAVVNGQPGFQRTENVFETDLGASWELDLFGGVRRGQQSAASRYQAAKTDVEAARLAVAAQAVDLYVSIRGLQARIAITQEQVTEQRNLLSLVRLQLGKGVASPLQANQAEGLLAQVEAGLPALATALDASLNAFDVLLGTQPGTYRAELQTPRAIPRAPGIDTAVGPADLVRRRPDLVAAEYQLKAANAQIGVAVSEYYPKFSFSGLLGSAAIATQDLYTGGAGQWQGAFGLRWRLFDFARVDAEVSSARGRYAEALAAYRLAVLRATEDVENAFSQLINAESQEATLARGEAALTQARDASLAAYRGGAVSLIEVIDADTRLLNTRDARAQARTQTARAAVASFRSLGGGWSSAVPIEASVAQLAVTRAGTEVAEGVLRR